MSRCKERGLLDDKPEIVRRRLKLFCDRTIPILDYYEHRQRLLSIDGNQPPELVQQNILEKLKTLV